VRRLQLESAAPATCGACGRTFADGRKLAAHAKSCVAAPQCAGCGARFGATPAGAAALRKHEAACCPPVAADDDSVAPPPKTTGVVCYLCGRRCLVASVRLHVPRCLERWREDAAAALRVARDRLCANQIFNPTSMF